MTAPEANRTATLTAFQLGPAAMKIVPAPAARDWIDATDRRFANRCLPLLMANQNGWLILNNLGFTAQWSGEDRVNALSITYDEAPSQPLAGTYFGYGVITWSIPYLFRTPPGYNLLARGPANSPKDGVYPLEGMVETDWSSATFTMNWKITRANTPIRFEPDEPICMIVPQRRGELEGLSPEIRPLSGESELSSRHLAWAASRSRFLRDLADGAEPATTAAWQRDYFRGRDGPGAEAVGDHQTRLRLLAFEQTADPGRNVG